jgi:GntP family gluconate:H+ symporter
VAVLVAMLALGRGGGMNRDQINDSLGAGLPGVASILLIVAAGGGFKQMLVDSGVAHVVADAAKHSQFSPLLLGWLVAVGIRLATGRTSADDEHTIGVITALTCGNVGSAGWGRVTTTRSPWLPGPMAGGG